MEKILITENNLNNIIANSISKILNESMLLEFTNNLSAEEFRRDMADLGFVQDPNIGVGSDSQSWYIPEYGDKYRVTIHLHSNKGTQVKADTLRHVKNALLAMGWFNVPGNIDKFPFQKWGASKKDIEPKYSEEFYIDKANEKYKDLKVWPVFPDIDDSVYVLSDEENKKYNLCRNPKDRRPLFDEWFDGYGLDRATESIQCLKRDDDENIVTLAYPITPEGKLKEPIEENKNNKNKKLWKI